MADEKPLWVADSTGRCNTLISASAGGVLQMTRIGLLDRSLELADLPLNVLDVLANGLAARNDLLR